MRYIDGMVAAVPTASKEEYKAHAVQAAAVFKKHGALSLIECWGDDVPEGDVNSLHTAVMRKPDETVVMSYITWESKQARDAGWAKMMEDPDMPHEMPFDGKRMIFGGFNVILES